MERALRILHLEDDPADAELVATTLAAEGLMCEFVRCSSRSQFVAAIDGAYDLILADFALPSFDGVSAQRIARERRPDLPFVFVSGTIGEEVAIERLKDGATDYVLKQRLERLPSAVRRALDEVRERHERRKAESEVRRLNAELEQRVVDRTAQLADAYRELEKRGAELHEAKAFLEDVVAASPSMIFRFDPNDLRTTYVSPNIGWLLGYTPDEVIGVPGFWERIIHPDDHDRVFGRLRAALDETVAQIEQEYRCRSKDGRYRWFFNLLRIEYDAAGLPTGILGYALDIADRKAAEAELHQANAFLDSIVEHLPAMIFVKDAADLRFVRSNRAGEDLLGLRRADLIGRTDRDLFPRQLADAFTEKDREVLRGREVMDIPEEIIATPKGGPRVLHTRKIPIFDAAGNAAYLLGISEDITERKAAEEDVRLARLEAERANRAKSDFLSRMSHDLRTPLNAVLGFAQLLEMDAVDGQQAEAVRQILKGGRLLLELINEVLDIARIEAGHLSLSPEPVAVGEVVHQVVDFVRPLGQTRGIAISADVAYDATLYVHLDRQRLKQILLNLVGNAVKYNHDGGSVRVSCERRPGGRVLISVADTGAGIPPQKLGLLFQPFERLGAEETTVEGTGLGLAVSKALTEAMGGTIGARSTIDRGSTFWIEFGEVAGPSIASAAPIAAPIAEPARAAAGLILYIEDNQANVRLMERLLARREGVRLIHAPNGAAGLRAAKEAHPDLIFLDLHLPDVSGEELLRRLWADPDTRATPVAVLSADATPSQAQRLLTAGAIAYLTKPLEMARVLRLVDERLATRREVQGQGRCE